MASLIRMLSQRDLVVMGLVSLLLTFPFSWWHQFYLSFHIILSLSIQWCPFFMTHKFSLSFRALRLRKCFCTKLNFQQDEKWFKESSGPSVKKDVCLSFGILWPTSPPPHLSFDSYELYDFTFGYPLLWPQRFFSTDDPFDIYFFFNIFISQKNFFFRKPTY